MLSLSTLRSAVVSLALAGLAHAAPLEERNTTLPIVDLGYELHQPTFNSTGRYYNFSNIRYAAPPVGDLRWRAPQAPAVDRSKINDGSVARICPQANPGWETTASTFIVDRLLGLNYTGGDGNTFNTSSSVTLPTQSPASSEDCLFLDVFVPQEIFESKKAKAPVLVWIYGGGYTAGYKHSSSPSGLLERSEDKPTTGGVIYVALNYRLGAFGWLSGAEVGKDGVANAGLYDQRFALEWVQKNIHLFGGDKDRVTVFGESAGGGSIMHQITAYGGDECNVTPFQQAILQSPGWDPAVSAADQEATYKDLLELLNVTSLSAARKVSSEALILASYTQVYHSGYGQFTYGPVTDGKFVPEQPARLLAEGKFDKNLKIMAGHNAQEGLLFTPPSAGANSSSLGVYLRANFDSASQDVISYITDTLYPPVYDGSQGYTDNVGRVVKVVSEYIFVCNTFYTDLAYNNKTYAYNFDVPPALHGQDVAYTYFTGNENTPNQKISALNPYAVTNVTLAITLQEFITSFAQTGKPVAKDGVPVFEMYGKDAKAEILNQTGITIGLDSAASQRCRWWQKQLYL